MKEIWKNIDGFDNYKISNFGRIKSLNYYNKTNKEKIMKPYIQPNGYNKITLWKNKKSYQFYVHRLVAQTFIPNPNNLETVNHKDENKSNNKVSNLEWMTQGDNVNYNNGRKRRVETLLKNKKTYGSNNSKAKAVYCFELNKSWNSISEAADELGINKSTLRHGINNIRNGKNIHCGKCNGVKLTWKYLENNEED